MDQSPHRPEVRTDWLAGPVADLDFVASRDRWGLALMAVGWVHLAVFLVCHLLHVSGDRHEIHYVLAWGLELFGVILVLRVIAGRGWYRSTPLAGLIARVWITFLILSFNLASLNNLTGMDQLWFKPPLSTLSSFGFMTMAYLLGWRYFIPAVQMYFTGLLMALNPDHCYLIYALSWWVALQAIGLILERRRQRRRLAASDAVDLLGSNRTVKEPKPGLDAHADGIPRCDACDVNQMPHTANLRQTTY
ncbi:MAG: hypothetical protein ABI353_13270 [Isosphaeraceae bacterium]